MCLHGMRNLEKDHNSMRREFAIARAVGNAEFRKQDLRIINRVIPVLNYHFVRDISTCIPSVCTSPAKASL